MTYSTMSTASVEDRRRRYQCDNGFDAEINQYGRIIMRAGAVDGIRMPLRLAESVRIELGRHGHVAPIIVTHAIDVWTFLTHGARTEDHLNSPFDPLTRYQATRTVPGCVITLPGPNDPMRSWLVEPDATERPDFATLLAITLDAAHSLPKVR